VVKVGLRWEHY